MAMVNIKDIPKEKVLAALYNASHSGSVGMISRDADHVMTHKEALKLLGGQSGRLSFDYLKGRVMKVDITGDEFDPSGYDLRNGKGAAALALVVV